VRGGLVVFYPTWRGRKTSPSIDDAMRQWIPSMPGNIAGGEIDVALEAIDVELREPHDGRLEPGSPALARTELAKTSCTGSSQRVAQAGEDDVLGTVLCTGEMGATPPIH